MDIVGILSSVNKIGLAAFFVTLGFLIYEIYLLNKTKKTPLRPDVPQFREGISTIPASKILLNVKPPPKNKNKLILLLLILLLIVFGVVSLVGISKLKSVEISKGIRIFDRDFKPIRAEEIGKLSEGKSIIIGVETIKDSDIDQARIRVNSDVWRQENITQKFAKKFNVFFITYVIPTGVTKLKIEAQLHSFKNGWLGN